jgi:NRPS condensation-like uncharacterized protein
MDKLPKIPRRFPSQGIDRAVAYIDPTGESVIQLEMEFTQKLDAARLARAATLALDAEPVLGCRFVHHWWKPYWVRLAHDVGSVFSEAQNEAEFESFKLAPIDAYKGPQIRVCLWNSADGARLLLKVSHQVADAAGVRSVSMVISSIYSRLSYEPDYQPEPNLKSSRGVRQVLRAIPLHSYPVFFLQNLRDHQNQVRGGTLTLPFPDGSLQPLSFINRFLPQDRVLRLVEQGRMYNATINDLLLAAFFRALVITANWDGRSQLRVNMTIDLRRHLINREASIVANLSLDIDGWPSLGTDLGKDHSATLDKVTTITRTRKQNFLGIDSLIGLLPFYICPHTWAAKLTEFYYRQQVEKGNLSHFFTNMGPIDPTAVDFGSRPTEARLLPPVSQPPWFILGISGYGGTLTLSAGVYAVQRDLTERLLDAMVAELSNI